VEVLDFDVAIHLTPGRSPPLFGLAALLASFDDVTRKEKHILSIE